ncbi:MAG: hypothetical protein ISS78_02020 [Phycisphaerae bacterium]|nr:hypothetical protein [Phycisphaerae bacterium]
MNVYALSLRAMPTWAPSHRSQALAIVASILIELAMPAPLPLAMGVSATTQTQAVKGLTVTKGTHDTEATTSLKGRVQEGAGRLHGGGRPVATGPGLDDGQST